MGLDPLLLPAPPVHLSVCLCPCLCRACCFLEGGTNNGSNDADKVINTTMFEHDST